MKAESRGLTTPLPGGGEDGTTVTVEPLLGAETQVPQRFMESNGGRLALLRATGIGVPKSRWWWIPIPAFLITHPTAGPILVDSAMHPGVSAKPAANLGRAIATFAKFRFPDGDLPTQLRARGHDPKSIKTVILTHLHFDHASGISEFPNSTFVLSRAEWEGATEGPRPLLEGYRRSHFDYLFDYRTIDFSRGGIESYASFGRTFDLLGDGSIRLAFTPGHTAGHMCVIARLRDHDFVIAGDAVYTADQLEGNNVPPRPHDEHQWQRSRRDLQRFARQFPQAVVVPSHDPQIWAGLADRYE
jgi:N-acyl homoserine lactone hydrolase